MFTRLWKIGNTTLFDLQFVGDGMLAFFNAPHAVSDHAAQAREAAQAAQHSLDQFNQATPLWRASAVGFSA
jgi:class 3 adenylate cyclase